MQGAVSLNVVKKLQEGAAPGHPTWPLSSHMGGECQSITEIACKILDSILLQSRSCGLASDIYNIV